MSRTWLVARREVVENVRTKTFWIGILSFPVILALSILIPTWLQSRIDVRPFGVEDRSGWLLKELKASWSLPDLPKLAAALRGEEDAPPLPASGLPACLREGGRLKAALRALDGDRLQAFLGSLPLLAGLSSDEFSEGLGKGAAGAALGGFPLPESLKREARAFHREVLELRTWWKGLPKEEAEPFRGPDGFGRYRLEAEAPEKELKEMLARGELFAYFVINEDPVEGSKGAEYFSKNLTDTKLREWMTRQVSRIVRARRVAKLRLTPEKAEWLNRPFRFASRTLDASGKESKVEKSDVVLKWAPMVFVYLLWISVFILAQMLLTNTIEEKSNRIIEVLLSSVSPRQLMTGKIFGIAITGLMMVGSWALFFILGVEILPLLFPEASRIISEFELARILAEPIYLLSFFGYFLAGYLLFASLLAGIGSVCNSLKEAQNLQQPVMILLLVPLFAMMPVASDPNGTLARVLSFIPPFTPFVMMNRAGGPPETWEYLATGVLLALTVFLTFRGAAKVFRVGILMTGKPPRIREILRWLGAPTGSIPKRGD